MTGALIVGVLVLFILNIPLAFAMLAASGYSANRAGVTRLTRTSVHWADRMVATSN